MAKPKVTMPDDLKSKCAAVIHTATTAAAAAGVIPIPMADTIPITGAQMTMIMGLAKVFDIPMTQAAAQSILGGTMASQAGRAIFSNIIKGIPGVGTVVGGVISAGTSVATVYKGNIIKNLIMDCQSYTKYRPNETTGGIFVSWRRKEELPTGA